MGPLSADSPTADSFVRDRGVRIGDSDCVVEASRRAAKSQVPIAGNVPDSVVHQRAYSHPVYRSSIQTTQRYLNDDA